MRHGVPEIYEYYVQKGGPLSLSQFRAVVSDFNQSAMDRVIYNGEELDLGANLSSISIIRVGRNFRTKRSHGIDWKASKEYKQELIDEGETPKSKEHPDGKNWFIHFTNEVFFRFYWAKRRCNVRNKTAYRFTATRGIKGNKTKLKELLASDDMAHLMYEEA